MLRQLLSSIYPASRQSFQLQEGLLWKAPGYSSAQVSTKHQWSWVSGFQILPLAAFFSLRWCPDHQSPLPEHLIDTQVHGGDLTHLQQDLGFGMY